MMHFGRTGRQNNRSQHDLVGTVAPPSPALPDAGLAAAARAGTPAASGKPPLSASSNAAFSSNESFDSTRQGQSQLPQPPQSQSQTQAQQSPLPPLPPPHSVNTYAGVQGDGSSGPPHLHHSNTVTAAFNPRQRDPDFADQVARSQSHRFSQVSPAQSQQQQQQQLQQQHQAQLQYGVPSGSADNLHDASGITSPIHPLQGQPIAAPHQPQSQPPKKQSTRKLIKNILSGSNNRGPEPHQHISQNSYNNTSGLARRPSKRISQPPPIRTGASQVSLEQPSGDWKSPGQPSRISPLQGVGEFQEQPYVTNDSNPDLRLQGAPEGQRGTTIRQVPIDADSASYGGQDVNYLQQQGHIQLQGQAPPGLQTHQYNQVVFDPSNQQQHPQQQQQQYQFANPQQGQYQSGSLPVIGGHLGSNPHQNPETVSQQSHESPVADPDQPSSATNTQPTQLSPSVNYPPKSETPTSAHATQSPQLQNMPPPPGQAPMGRRSQEAEKPPPGPPPSYRHSQQPPGMNTLPPPSAGGQQQAYRQGPGQERAQFEGQAIEGRHSPQPPTSDRGESDPEKAFKDLLSKYKNVKRLYFDGKKEIEQQHAQIEHLQNAVAKQRMSQSRTSLDDSEYTTRFNRLNGAINNLAFNIRKDWVTLPSWLVSYVSNDALKTGKQEMTAVGRAVITRWVVEEIFHSSFHPGLEPELSSHLKQIEQNIRHFSHTISSQEEYDALTTKVVNWRMATLEGLTEVLRGPESAEHKADFTQRATSNLTAYLYQHLADPPPPGVDGSASMIVELAVAIAANLPLESRDVAVMYPLPEQPIRTEIMEVEKSGLPSLETRTSEASDEGAGEENGKDNNSKDRRGDKSRPGAPPSIAIKEPGKVRFAGFVAVEVRGRQVLIKAPVWTLA